MENFAKKYLEEASEIISSLESLILKVEENPSDIDQINEVFRLLHTLKGGGAMFGFTNISEVTHELESIYDCIRSGKAFINGEILNETFTVIDYVKNIIENKEVSKFEHVNKVERLKEFKENFIKGCKNGTISNSISENNQKKNIKADPQILKINQKSEPENKKSDKTQIKSEKKIDKKDEKLISDLEKKHKPQLSPKKEIKTYRLFFKPNENILKTGTDPLLLVKELSETALCKIFSVFDFIPEISELIYDNCYLSWIVYVVSESKNTIDDVFIFVEDDSIIDCEQIFEGNAFEDLKFVENLNDRFLSDKEYFLKKYLPASQRLKNIASAINSDEVKDTDQLLETKNNSIQDSHNLKNDFLNELKNNNENHNKVDLEENNNDFEIFDIQEEKVELKEQLEIIEKIQRDMSSENEDTELNTVFIDENNSDNKNDIFNKTIPTEQEFDNQVKKLATITTLRISSEKIDYLMNLVSELITTQARLINYSERTENAELEIIVENINKISRQLRDNAFEMSMIPFQSVVLRFQRLVRDLSAKLNKDVEFRTQGTSTEIDKRIIENLIDPIMHMLRNSIDHGIESKEERIKAGKQAKGVVFLNAFYAGTNVYIQVGDDGRGINVDLIKHSAFSKGFLNSKNTYTNEEILNVIFEPGFSTQKNLSDVSGRGVGLDVVKRNVTELRGDISVESISGKGTTFTIKLPLTLSIIDGLLIQIGKEKFIIPMNEVSKIYEIKHSHLNDSFYNILVLDGKQVPYLYLREEFNVNTDIFETEQVLVVNTEDKSFGIIVDKVIGEYQAVLKPLGKMFLQQQIFSGATILGDGSVVLVIDVRSLYGTLKFNSENLNTI